jgi:hypothetical protein
MKAFTQVWKSITGVPAASMADKRYTFVTYDTNSKVITPAADGASVVGVIYEPNGADEPAQVVASGFAFVQLGANLSAGADVMANASGQAVAYALGTAPAYNTLVGTLVVGGSTGEIGTVLLK